MKLTLQLAVLTVLTALSTACDIQPVSVGIWDITIDSPEGRQSSVWTISADDTIGMVGESVTEADEVSLNGSRITWSVDASVATGSQERVQRINFIGTVDGNSLAGTVFTTVGNFSVNGTRQ